MYTKYINGKQAKINNKKNRKRNITPFHKLHY